MSEEKKKNIKKKQLTGLHLVGWAGTFKFALGPGFNSKEGDRVRKGVRKLGGHFLEVTTFLFLWDMIPFL